MWIHFFFDFTAAQPFLLFPILLSVSNLFKKVAFQTIKRSLMKSIKQFVSYMKSRESESLLRSLTKKVSTEFYVTLTLCSGVEDFKPIISYFRDESSVALAAKSLIDSLDTFLSLEDSATNKSVFIDANEISSE